MRESSPARRARQSRGAGAAMPRAARVLQALGWQMTWMTWQKGQLSLFSWPQEQRHASRSSGSRWSGIRSDAPPSVPSASGRACTTNQRVLHICNFAYLQFCNFAYLHICIFAYLHICIFAICIFAFLQFFSYLHGCMWVWKVEESQKV